MFAKFKELDPKKKRTVVFIITGAVIGLMLITIAAMRLSDTNVEPTLPTVKRGQEFGRQDAIVAERYRKDIEIAEKQKELDAKNAELEQLRQDLESMQVEESSSKSGIQPYEPSSIVKSYPQPPNADGSLPPLPARPNDTRQELQPPVRTVHGISSYAPEMEAEPVEDVRPVKTNFIPANTKIPVITLNGVYAPTRAAGKSSPYPVIMRVHDMSFLPNDLQRDLKGCEMQGEAHGELQEARAHIRITKITCVSRDGRKVLEKDMEGWVNGEDGMVGMAGVIEDNFGMLLSKTFIAQTVAGLGEALESSTQVVTNNALGSISQYTEDDYEDMGYAAVGKGLSESFKLIANFMMDLLRDQSPVIRVHARREVVVVVRTGLELIPEEMRWVGIVDAEHATEAETIINELKGLK
jgi:conjugal transfer pilus assembly protein TraB